MSMEDKKINLLPATIAEQTVEKASNNVDLGQYDQTKHVSKEDVKLSRFKIHREMETRTEALERLVNPSRDVDWWKFHVIPTQSSSCRARSHMGRAKLSHKILDEFRSIEKRIVGAQNKVAKLRIEGDLVKIARKYPIKLKHRPKPWNSRATDRLLQKRATDGIEDPIIMSREAGITVALQHEESLRVQAETDESYDRMRARAKPLHRSSSEQKVNPLLELKASQAEKRSRKLSLASKLRLDSENVLSQVDWPRRAIYIPCLEDSQTLHLTALYPPREQQKST